MRAREFILRETTQGGDAELAQSQQIIAQTKQAFRQQFKQDLKTNSEHRDRAKQAELHARGQQGERGIYMPLDPNKYPQAKYFHLFSMDISPATLKPEHRTWLQQQGWQLVHGARDPVHWQYVSKALPGTAKQAPSPQAPKQDAEQEPPTDPNAPKNMLGRLLRLGNVGSTNLGSMDSWDDFLIGR
jgi:hypothetical protein